MVAGGGGKTGCVGEGSEEGSVHAGQSCSWCEWVAVGRRWSGVVVEGRWSGVVVEGRWSGVVVEGRWSGVVCECERRLGVCVGVRGGGGWMG